MSWDVVVIHKAHGYEDVRLHHIAHGESKDVRGGRRPRLQEEMNRKHARIHKREGKNAVWWTVRKKKFNVEERRVGERS